MFKNTTLPIYLTAGFMHVLSWSLAEQNLLLPQLADSLVPLEIKPGISLATVSAVLHTKDNKHVLQVQFNGKGRKNILNSAFSCHLGPHQPLLQLLPSRAEPWAEALPWHVLVRNYTQSREWDANKSLCPLFLGHVPGWDKRGSEIIPEERLQIILPVFQSQEQHQSTSQDQGFRGERWPGTSDLGPSALSSPGSCTSLYIPAHSLPATPFRLALEFLAWGGDAQEPSQQWLPWSPFSQIHEPH